MSKLLVYLEGELVGECQLDRERIVIGRKPNNDLQLAHSAVSGSHALLITIRNDSFLEDLNSTNGTKVNGKSIKKCLLRDGDEIRIAKHILKYVFEPIELKPDEEAISRSGKLRHLENLIRSADDTLSVNENMLRKSPTFSSTMQINASPGKPVPKSPANELPPQAGLQILSGVGAGQEMNLDRILTTLGKPGIQVAVIMRRPEGYALTHLEGDKRPLLNGVAISEQPQVLEDHDIIEIAGIKLEFCLKGYPSVQAGDRQGASAPSQ
ncbi:MAG: FHA domain-containing protein [Sulfuricella sp.]|nr:FHA domain-containing protein [Gammaproteobacteria bacterium]